MNISFLKNLMGQIPDQSIISGATGTVPAFPEDMIFETNLADTEMPSSYKGEQSPSEMTGSLPADIVDHISVDERSFEKSVSTPVQNRPDEFVNNILATVDLPVLAAQKLPNPDNDSGSGTINLSEIDPSSKILPFANVQNGVVTGSAGFPSKPAGQPAAEDSLQGEPESEIVNSKRERSAHTENNPVRIRTENSLVQARSTIAEPGSARSEISRDKAFSGTNALQSTMTSPQMPGSAVSQAIHMANDDLTKQFERLNSASVAVELTDIAEKANDTKLTNMPVQLIQNLKQLRTMPAPSLHDQAQNIDLGEDLPSIEPAISEVPPTDEMPEPLPATALPASMRQKRVAAIDSTSALSSVQMKEVSGSVGRTPEISAARPTADISAESILDFDSNFIANIAREIGNIAQSKGIARFSLRPEHLGRIDVEIRGGEQGDDVKITAETETVRHILAQSQSRLEQEARLHGHRLNGVEIGTNLNQSNGRGAQDSERSEESAGSPSDHLPESNAQQRNHGDRSAKPNNNARFA